MKSKLLRARWLMTELRMTCLRMTWLLLVGISSFAKENKLIKFQIREDQGPNLLHETRVLRLLEEPSVQVEAKPRSRSYSFYLGTLSGQHFTVQSSTQPVTYDLQNSMLSLGFGYTQYPFFWQGQWGWQASLGYASTNGAVGPLETKLHIFPSQLGLCYRGRAHAGQLWAPLLGAGLGNMVLVQRGADRLNTSESQFVGYARAGLWWGFGEQFQKNSRTPYDASLFYQQTLSKATRDSDWSGGSIVLGVGLSI